MRVTDTVGPDHPAIAGHFPGNPVVPGVLLLARVARALESALGAKASTLLEARFHALLRPGETFEIEFEPAGPEQIRFRVLRDGTRIAAGTLAARPAPAT